MLISISGGINIRNVCNTVYSRKKYINKMVKRITINESNIVIETHTWFTYSSIGESISLSKIMVDNSSDIPFLEEKNLFVKGTRY